MEQKIPDKPPVFSDWQGQDYDYFTCKYTAKYLNVEDTLRYIGYSPAGFNVNKGMTNDYKCMLIKPFPDYYSPEQEQQEAQEAFFANTMNTKLQMLGRVEALDSHTGSIIKN